MNDGKGRAPSPPYDCRFLLARRRRFKYDPTNKRVTLQIFYGATSTGGTVYEMASNISAVGFGPAVMGQDWNNTTVVQHVPISVSVTVGKNFVTLNGAAGPRRAQKSY